jgi:signal transduction histidine kinase/ligand-binding sensor domain-containing protein
MRFPRATNKIYYALFLLVWLNCPARGQYRFDVWSTDNGLPHNSLYSIIQTRDGYLWIATTDGLVRYDGVRFSIFNTANTKGLSGNRFTALYEDTQGTLWVGTEGAGLIKFKAGDCVVYRVKDGLPDDIITAIEQDPADNLLVATFHGYARRVGERFDPYLPPLPRPHRAFGFLERQGGAWDFGQTGPHKLGDAIASSYRALRLPARTRVYSANEDRAGVLWIGTTAGLIRMQGGSPRLYTEKDGLPKSPVKLVKEDRAGNFWVGTNDGLYQFKDGRFISLGMAGRQITDILEDREGILWITTGSGLWRMSKQVVTTYSDKHGLADNNVYPIYEDRAGRVWIGTWERGVTVYQNGRFSRTPIYTELPRLLVTSFVEDAAGRLWVGAYVRVGWLENGKIHDLTHLLTREGQPVPAILPDTNGNLWIATDTGLLKLRADKLDEKPTVYTVTDGLAGNDVRVLLQDRQSQIWVGTYSGLTRIADGKLTSWKKGDGLASEAIRSLHEDEAGALWIGTYDGGISRLKDGRIVSITMDVGLFNNGVFQILPDGRGNLWMSCNLGLYRVSKQQLDDYADGKIHAVSSISYGKSDGMLNPECNGGSSPAGVRTRGGKLWFPTQMGVAVIDPATIESNPHPPTIVIEECLLDREGVDFSQLVRIAPGQHGLEIRYTALSFIKPEYIHFKHRMEGLDSDWVDAGTRRSVYYSSLPPGEYDFHVIAANSDGVWNTAGQRLRVIVLPPFYRTWWFVCLAALCITGLAALFYRRRIAQLQRAHAAREEFARQLIASQEAERKRIAAELHDSLGQNLLIIKNRAILGDQVAGDRASAKEQFGEITEAVTQALGEVREIAYNLRPYHLDRVGLTGALEAMVEKVAEASGISFKIEVAPVDEVFPKDVELSLYRIAQECLNNIVKHAGAMSASFIVTREADEMILKISDDGCGFSPDALAADSSRRGFGLLGISERVRLLDGSHALRSAPGEGTTTVIRLRLPDLPHLNREITEESPYEA